MPREQLIKAISDRDLTAASELSAKHPETVADRATPGPSPLLMAAYMRDPSITAELRRWAEPDIHEAAALGDADAVRARLTESPGCVETLSGDGWYPLHLAAFFGHLSIAKMLLGANATPTVISTNGEANSPLHAALAGAAANEVVYTLLEAGAEVNCVAGSGVTPLHIAASRGNTELVEELLRRGAFREAATDDGKTAGDIAIERGYSELNELLTRDSTPQ